MISTPNFVKGLCAAVALAGSSASMAINPSLSSAVQTGSTLVVKGSNFGVKSTPAPTFFQPFTDLSAGATPTAAGFDSWINRGGEAVTLADGVGGGSLRCDPEKANNAFPHIGKYLPANTSEFRLSFYFKLYGSSTPIRQLKFVRAGVRGDSGPLSDYSTTSPKYMASMFLSQNRLLQNATHIEWNDSGSIVSYYPDEAGSGSSGVSISLQPVVDTSQWVYAEVYYKFNDVGVANGVDKIVLNGFTWQNRTTTRLRSSADQYIGYVQPLPSIDLDGNPAEYDYAMSRVYLDVGPQSQAQVFLSDSPTSLGVTKKFVLPATAWAADGITVSNAASIPAGYKYVYVTNVSGETNSIGLVLGAVQSPPQPPVLTIGQ